MIRSLWTKAAFGKQRLFDVNAPSSPLEAAPSRMHQTQMMGTIQSNILDSRLLNETRTSLHLPQMHQSVHVQRHFSKNCLCHRCKNPLVAFFFFLHLAKRLLGENRYGCQRSSPCTRSVRSSARYCICSESGPPHPYRRRATKAPLFRVCISPGGAEMQELRLHLMRKGLHTPLVIWSTWNPGHSEEQQS